MKMVKRMFLAAVAAMFVGAQVSAVVQPLFAKAVNAVFVGTLQKVNNVAELNAMVDILVTMLSKQPTYGYLQDEVTYVLGAFSTCVVALYEKQANPRCAEFAESAEFAEKMCAIVVALSGKIVSIATAKGQYSDPFKDDINQKITKLKQLINSLVGPQPLNTRQPDSTTDLITENQTVVQSQVQPQPSTVLTAASKQEQAPQPSTVHQVASNPTVVQQPSTVHQVVSNPTVNSAVQGIQSAAPQSKPKPASRTARSMAWSLGLFKNIWTFLKERATGAGDMGAFVN